MCRITAVISTRPASSSDLLCGSPKGLLSQADAAAGRFQDDGWGVGYFRGGAPAVIKSPGPSAAKTARATKTGSVNSRQPGRN